MQQCRIKSAKFIFITIGFFFNFLFYPIMVFVLNGYQQTNANLCVTNGWMPIDNAAAVAETHMIRWMLAKLDADIFSSPRFRNSIGYAFLSKNNAWLLQNWITINSVAYYPKFRANEQWAFDFAWWWSFWLRSQWWQMACSWIRWLPLWLTISKWK